MTFVVVSKPPSLADAPKYAATYLDDEIEAREMTDELPHKSWLAKLPLKGNHFTPDQALDTYPCRVGDCGHCEELK